MCGNSFIAGITLPDDIQLSLTSDESELSPDAGSPDSHQSASRATEAGWDSLIYCPMHKQSYSWIAYSRSLPMWASHPSPSWVIYNSILPSFLQNSIYCVFTVNGGNTRAKSSVVPVLPNRPIVYDDDEPDRLFYTNQSRQLFILCRKVCTYVRAFWSGYVFRLIVVVVSVHNFMCINASKSTLASYCLQDMNLCQFSLFIAACVSGHHWQQATAEGFTIHSFGNRLWQEWYLYWCCYTAADWLSHPCHSTGSYSWIRSHPSLTTQRLHSAGHVFFSWVW